MWCLCTRICLHVAMTTRYSTVLNTIYNYSICSRAVLIWCFRFNTDTDNFIYAISNAYIINQYYNTHQYNNYCHGIACGLINFGSSIHHFHYFISLVASLLYNALIPCYIHQLTRLEFYLYILKCNYVSSSNTDSANICTNTDIILVLVQP